MAEEIRVAWCIEEMDAGGFVVDLRVEARYGELEGVLKLFFERAVVADGSAVLKTAGGVDRSRFRE